MQNFDEIVLTARGIFSAMTDEKILGTVHTLDDIMDVNIYLN